MAELSLLLIPQSFKLMQTTGIEGAVTASTKTN
jgi:hypothetical protein